MSCITDMITMKAIHQSSEQYSESRLLPQNPIADEEIDRPLRSMVHLTFILNESLQRLGKMAAISIQDIPFYLTVPG